MFCEGTGNVIAVPGTVVYDSKGKRDLMSFTGLDLTSYARTELSGTRRSKGGASLPERVKATIGMVMYMTTFVTNENTRMGREALCRVDMQWGRQLHDVYVTTKKGGGDRGLRGKVSRGVSMRV